MPQIIVVADHDEVPAVIFRERVNRVVFESGHAAAQLLERLEWAIDDAHEVERDCRQRHQRIERAAGEQEWAGEDEADYPYADPRWASMLTTAS